MQELAWKEPFSTGHELVPEHEPAGRIRDFAGVSGGVSACPASVSGVAGAAGEDSASSALRTDSWQSLLREFVPRFSVIFLGLATLRVWIECCMYDRYLATDSGALTIMGTLCRVAVMLMLILACKQRRFSEKTEHMLDIASVILMTAAALLYYMQPVLPQVPLSLVASLLGSMGISWGAAVWIRVYRGFGPGEALLYTFLGLGLSAVLGFALGVFGAATAYALCMALPLASYLSAHRALALLEKRPASLAVAPVGRENDALNKKTLVALLTGVCLINFAMGVARGFPEGTSIPLSVGFQALHHGLVLALCLALCWWVLIRGHRLSLFLVWGAVCALVAVGIALIITSVNEDVVWGATLITAGNSFGVGVLWYCTYDFSRHSSASPYIVFGTVWISHLLPRELGRLLVFQAGSVLDNQIALTLVGAVVMVVLIAGMALLLSRKQESALFLFRELGFSYGSTMDKNAGEEARSAAGAGEEAAVAVDAATEAAALDACAGEVLAAAALDAHATEAPWQLLSQRFVLTERETQMVRYLAMGYSRASIGQKLFLSENTVKSYIRKVYVKVGVHSKQELLDLMAEEQSLQQTE